MRVQIRSLDQANQNTQNASSLMKTAEGAVSSTVEILKSLKEKAINAATDTNTDQDRATIQKEIDQFIDQIDDNALSTFNGKFLVDGSKSVAGVATRSTLTNQSLSTDSTGFSKLTELKNRNNENLEIVSNDKVTASFVMGGKTYTTTYTVSDTTVQDIFRKLNDEYNIKNDYVELATDTGAYGTGNSTATAAKYYVEDGEHLDMNSIDEGSTNTAVTPTTAGTTRSVGTTSADSGTGLVFAKGAHTDARTGNIEDVDSQTFKFTNAKGKTEVSGDGTNGMASDAAVYGVNGGGARAQAISTSTVVTHSFKVNERAGVRADAFGFGIDAYDSTKSNSVSSGTGVIYSGVDGNGFSVYGTSTGTSVYGNAMSGASLVSAGTQVGVKSSMDREYTADGTMGLTVTSKRAGIDGQISGVTISISDSEGNVKKSANAALDAFNTKIFAKNESDANELSFQVGASANQSIAVGLEDMRSEALGLKGSDGSKVSVATQDKANAAVKVFDNAIQKALDQQTTIGSVEARLEYTGNNLTTSSENVQAAESTIRDADMAKEMTTYTKNNVLLQAAQSMLAQANQSSSAVLSLLQ
jgi:flagellin